MNKAKARYMGFNVDAAQGRFTAYVKLEKGMQAADAQHDAAELVRSELGGGANRVIGTSARAVDSLPDEVWASKHATNWGWMARGHLPEVSVVVQKSGPLRLRLTAGTPQPGSPAHNMVEAARAQYPVNPMNERELLVGGARVELSYGFGDRNLILKSVEAMEKSAGHGAAALAAVLSLADRYKVDLTLHAVALGEQGLEQGDLSAWYERHGFSRQQNGTMLRQALVGLPDPKLKIDNPGGRWLENNRRYIAEDGLNQFGSPAAFGPITGHFDRHVLLPVGVLRGVPGLRNEQDVVREADLRSLVAYCREAGRFPPAQAGDGRTYDPFVQVVHDGKAWTNEGNHRIMTADVLGWEYVPVDVRYFVGGETMDGPLTPAKVLEYDRAARAAGYTPELYGAKWPGYRPEQAPNDDAVEAGIRACLSKFAVLEIADTTTRAFTDAGRAAEIGRIMRELAAEVERGRPRCEVRDANGNEIGRFTFLSARPAGVAAQGQDGSIRIVFELEDAVLAADRQRFVGGALRDSASAVGDGVAPLTAHVVGSAGTGRAEVVSAGFGPEAQAEAALRAVDLRAVSAREFARWNSERVESGLDAVPVPSERWREEADIGRDFLTSERTALVKELYVRDPLENEIVYRKAWYSDFDGGGSAKLVLSDHDGRECDVYAPGLESRM